MRLRSTTAALTVAASARSLTTVTPAGNGWSPPMSAASRRCRERRSRVTGSTPSSVGTLARAPVASTRRSYASVEPSLSDTSRLPRSIAVTRVPRTNRTPSAAEPSVSVTSMAGRSVRPTANSATSTRL
jgi:hypothetical protein